MIDTSAIEEFLDIDLAHTPTCRLLHPMDVHAVIGCTKQEWLTAQCTCGAEAARERARRAVEALKKKAALADEMASVELEIEEGDARAFMHDWHARWRASEMEETK